MSRGVDEILLRRGRLIERIAGQRAALRRDFVPVAAALGRVDAARARVNAGIDWIGRHALAASAVACLVMAFKGKAALRLAAKSFTLWKSWRWLRRSLRDLEKRLGV